MTEAVGPVVLTVNVEGVPGTIEPELNEHVGANVGAGCTEQVRATAPLNPPAALATFNVEVDGAPGLTAAGVSAEAERE
jgi:hypothetical protein